MAGDAKVLTTLQLFMAVARGELTCEQAATRMEHADFRHVSELDAARASEQAQRERAEKAEDELKAMRFALDITGRDRETLKRREVELTRELFAVRAEGVELGRHRDPNINSALRDLARATMRSEKAEARVVVLEKAMRDYVAALDAGRKFDEFTAEKAMRAALGGQVKKTKRAEAWNEEVAYVDCPECGTTIELESGLIWEEGFEQECPKCFESFIVEKPE